MQPKADRYIPIILRRAIQTAQDNNLKLTSFDGRLLSFSLGVGWVLDPFTGDGKKQYINLFYENGQAAGTMSAGDLIFSHAFAKALWGEGKHALTFPEGKIHMQAPAWEYHLQQMIIDPDPIEYLGRNI